MNYLKIRNNSKIHFGIFYLSLKVLSAKNKTIFNTVNRGNIMT